ncbi:Hypothetical_protein [Hexamita inflata]|uniref:Hypothetical_protein n=1 Tax=Hexamita inflata TaxID=28002 RepID=A0AA86PJ44_9EUKA|nr:Hypothetical protein HINF_LOCUS27681 [Hexamita inflata]
MNIHNIVLETDQTISCAQYVQNQTLFSTTKTFFIQSESELYNKYKFKAPIIYFKFLTDKIILVQTIDRVYIRDTEYGAQIALGNHGLVLSADGVKDNDTIVIAVIVSRLQPVLEMYYYNQTTRQVAARPEALRVYNRTSLVQIYGFDARTEVVQMLLKGDYVQLEGIYANKDSKMDKRQTLWKKKVSGCQIQLQTSSVTKTEQQAQSGSTQAAKTKQQQFMLYEIIFFLVDNYDVDTYSFMQQITWRQVLE